MYQAIVKKGKVLAENTSAPLVDPGRILIRVVYSCISAGTEMSGVKESGISISQRLLKQPQKIKDGIDLVRKIGINKTIALVKGITEGGAATGYSASGLVLSVGSGVKGFSPGDRVAASGGGLANHAEYISVPENLVMKLQDNVGFKEASTVSLGGIAMQGVRRAGLTLGEFCVVTGAGIVGLITIQILHAAGIRVAAIDPDEKRLSLAKHYGAELIINPSKDSSLDIVSSWTGGYGADAVIFTAGVSSSEPLSLAFQLCRKKGQVVLVGVSGMEINRKDIFAKELDFKISTSYGPGRYDNNYELNGADYPYAYVRWTENRNMGEYLRLLSTGQISIKEMIAAEYPIKKATEAYEALSSPEKPIIILLSYGEPHDDELQQYLHQDKKVVFNNHKLKKDVVNVALVGAGNFATAMHLPNIKTLSDKFALHCVVNRTGSKANNIAKQYGAKYATTDFKQMLDDKEVDLVLITTRHDSHASLVLQALKAGKHVFVEKPLTTTHDDMAAIKAFYDSDAVTKPVLMTGFNRRFSPMATEIKGHTDKRINPLFIQYRMNAGCLAGDHWVHENGGRIVGEACHLIDLMTFFTGSKVVSVSYESLNPNTEKVSSTDNKSIVLKYSDGSVCTIQYFSQGNKDLPKEYMEIHFDGKSIIMEDYKNLKGYGLNMNKVQSQTSEKGQRQELEALHETLTGNKDSWPIELWDMEQTTETSILVATEC